jgi:septal ring factor EnvC (AmiA/AmiB activator)
MDDAQRRALADARATVDRVSRLIPRNETTQQEPSINRLDQWRAGVEQQERAFAASRAKRQKAEQDERSNTDEWTKWVGDQIAAAVLHCTRTLAETLRDELDARDTTISKLHAQLHRLIGERDMRIDKLEREIAQLAVQHSKLEVRLLQALADSDHARTIDLPNMRKGLN